MEIIRTEDNQKVKENFARLCREQVDNHWISFCLPYIQKAVKNNAYSCNISYLYASPHMDSFKEAFPRIIKFFQELGFVASTSNSQQDLYISWKNS